jgi:excisionase family DNA binding protein
MDTQGALQVITNLQNRLTYTIPQVVEQSNCSRSLLYTEMKAGRLRVLKVGRKTLITAAALQEWLRGLEQKTAR